VDYQTPYNAKVVAIADTYDAITSNPKNRRKPRIMLVRTADKKRIPKYAMLDLDLHPKTVSGELFAISKELPDGTFGVFIQRFIENGLVLGY